ncbi:MAG: copper resistance system multicopper oxidase [Acidobacteria bacterium]|nr:copper resistance system multicopper oxidase [Acidobacteriota bacterium]MDA1234001.1 copper resistance system multicopper oxidase [Acidobacteriota bacterium]
MRTRRDLLRTGAALGAAGLAHQLLPPWALGACTPAAAGLTTLSGTEFDLEVDHATVAIDGKAGQAITINGHLPAPLLRWREGDEVTLRVTNHLHDHDTSIHWHGILLPYQMDGVPGLSFAGIRPGETFTYRFPVRQNGTYWYHSHSGAQEQIGHYGPIIIDPQGADPVAYDREYVIVLSDWTFEDPHRLFSKLKKMSSNYNYQKRTVGDFFRNPLKDRGMWGRMRMSPTDLADVTAAAYTYLINGHSAQDNWTALFEPGQRVRLRIINASAMTIFDVRIPDLPLTVVQSDGLDVEPIETDEFRIGVAETYDVVVQPQSAQAFTLFCETIDRSGFARATLAPRPGMTAEVPARRPRPLLTMKDMGMDHAAMGHETHGSMEAAPAPDPHAGHTMPAVAPDPHAGHTMPAAEPDPHAGHTMPAAEPDPHAGHDMGAAGAGEMSGMQEHDHPTGPGTAGRSMQTSSRLAEPGSGLEDAPHRVLTYSQLRSRESNPDKRAPGREIELHLTGNMERYMWSFDGKKYSEGVEPIVLTKDERVRLTFVNDTMMAHPIHLHGMFFDVVNSDGDHRPRKHTILVKPAEKVSVDLTADALGDWAFHCHLLYHMHAGMFRVVSVREPAMPMNHQHQEAPR